jgi:hypothetical protein
MARGVFTPYLSVARPSPVPPYPTMDLRDQLQETLGPGYTIERELDRAYHAPADTLKITLTPGPLAKPLKRLKKSR